MTKREIKKMGRETATRTIHKNDKRENTNETLGHGNKKKNLNRKKN